MITDRISRYWIIPNGEDPAIHQKVVAVAVLSFLVSITIVVVIGPLIYQSFGEVITRSYAIKVEASIMMLPLMFSTGFLALGARDTPLKILLLKGLVSTVFASAVAVFALPLWS